MKHEVVYLNTDLICNNSVDQSESICKISLTRKLKNRRNDYYLLKEVIKKYKYYTIKKIGPPTLVDAIILKRRQ